MTLEIARLCGWVPQGTRRVAKSTAAPDGVSDAKGLIPWLADYISNDAQTVTAKDAALFADALTRAANDGPEIIEQWQAGLLQPPAVLRTPPTGFRWFGTPAGRKRLLDVAEFCRNGEFQIC